MGFLRLRRRSHDQKPTPESVVYVGSGDGTLYALDAASGAKQWVYQTGSSIYSSPAVAGGAVYVGFYNGNLYTFHLPGVTLHNGGY